MPTKKNARVVKKQDFVSMTVKKDLERNDAKRLFEWVLGGDVEDDRLIPLSHGLRVRIIGRAP